MCKKIILDLAQKYFSYNIIIFLLSRGYLFCASKLISTHLIRLTKSWG